MFDPTRYVFWLSPTSAGWASLRLLLERELLQGQRLLSASPATIDHFIDEHHRVWTHALTKIAREHIGSFVDDFFLLLLVEETLWELKICKWHCDSPFGVCVRYVWTEAFWLRNASAAAVLPPIQVWLRCFTNSGTGLTNRCLHLGQLVDCVYKHEIVDLAVVAS